ncbi:urease accessory protein UreD [Enterovibrio nigricans]|uniref:Urease accessory protein UreD n=1 Tax=Enterovibrio nigricans DSM 22720 TaxID=1121868 RepID=A0A1T4W0Q9_9GAMM|nr:urease accessory protein UreD [Enterovibrio nigricans]SKA70665.1 urease accessory protein [Enterovibrio nigricans DSM 22720]
MEQSSISRTNPTTSGHGRWEAELSLGFVSDGERTVLKHRSHRGPLAVQRSLYPEAGICHSHILHPPGGIVGGDALHVEVALESNAHALVTTPGATRFYRSDGRVALVDQSFRVAPHATLEFVPLENIAFPSAKLRTRTDIHLASTSRFVGFDLWTLGQPASNEHFGKGEIDGMTRVVVDGRLLLCERMRVNATTWLRDAASLRSNPVCGNIIAFGNPSDFQPVCEWWNAQTFEPNLDVGLTVMDGLLVVRGLSTSTEDLFLLMAKCWQQIRFHWTGDMPELPRIWRT